MKAGAPEDGAMSSFSPFEEGPKRVVGMFASNASGPESHREQLVKIVNRGMSGCESKPNDSKIIIDFGLRMPFRRRFFNGIPIPLENLLCFHTEKDPLCRRCKKMLKCVFDYLVYGEGRITTVMELCLQIVQKSVRIKP